MDASQSNSFSLVSSGKANRTSQDCIRLRALCSLPDEALVCRNDAAIFLGLKSQTLADWESKQRQTLPCVKIGRLAKYRMGALRTFVASQTHGGRS